MQWISWLFLTRKRQRRGKSASACRRIALRLERLEPRQVLASDSGFGAGDYSMDDGGQDFAPISAEEAAAIETPADVKTLPEDGASQLQNAFSNLPAGETLDELRMLGDLEAIEDHAGGAAGLPGPDDETGDGLTKAGELLVSGPSSPGMPGLPGGDDRREHLQGMLDVFRRGGERDGNEDAPTDPASRAGWAQDGAGRHVEADGTEHIMTWARRDGDWHFIHTTLQTDGTLTIETTVVHDDGGVDYSVEDVSPQGETTGSGEMSPGDEDVVVLEPVVITAKPDPDGQPNPGEDSDGMGFLDRDPWAMYLAWYTGRTGSPLKNPYDDDPGGDPTESGHGESSAAPRVGLEAVINPVDPLWGTTPGGGGDGDPVVPGCVDPDPVGPAW